MLNVPTANAIFYFDTSGSFVSQSIMVDTASYVYTSSFATTASYVSGLPSTTYSTITTGSANWITMSFSTENQYFNLTTEQVLNFTASNLPVVNTNFSDCTLFLKNSATGSSSLVFPAEWTNLAGGWPTTLTSSKSAMIWVRAYGTSSIVGTFSTEI